MDTDWMKFYFVHPQPERFVQEVRQWSAQGVLAHPQRWFVAAIFLSRLMAAHPACVRGWLDSLTDLPPDDLLTLERAAWFSGSAEAMERLPLRTAASKLGRVPDILVLPVNSGLMLDALWAHYFATGELRAVRRIVSALGYMMDFGAAQSFRDSKRSEMDRLRAIRDAVFQAAWWSLQSLMQENDSLRAFCNELCVSGDVSNIERAALARMLSSLGPESSQSHLSSEARAIGTLGSGSIPAKERTEETIASKPWWKFW